MCCQVTVNQLGFYLIANTPAVNFNHDFAFKFMNVCLPACQTVHRPSCSPPVLHLWNGPASNHHQLLEALWSDFIPTTRDFIGPEPNCQ